MKFYEIFPQIVWINFYILFIVFYHSNSIRNFVMMFSSFSFWNAYMILLWHFILSISCLITAKFRSIWSERSSYFLSSLEKRSVNSKSNRSSLEFMIFIEENNIFHSNMCMCTINCCRKWLRCKRGLRICGICNVCMWSWSIRWNTICLCLKTMLGVEYR